MADDAPPPPPGWYPEGEFALRWWNGQAWTDHRAVPALPSGSSVRRTVAIVLASVLGLAACVGSLVGYAYTSGKAHDIFSFDDRVVIDTAAHACTAVTEQIETARGTRVERIDAGNQAIAKLVADMNALGHAKLASDKPSIDWIADWQSLADARTTYAKSVDSTGAAARFAVPRTPDDYPITTRMADVAPPECERAVDLASHP